MGGVPVTCYRSLGSGGRETFVWYATSPSGLLFSILAASLVSNLVLLEAPHLLLCAVSLAGKRLGGIEDPSMHISCLP